MKRLLTLLLVIVAVVPAHAVAAGPTHVNGGGRGTVDGGVTPFSQFGFGVSIAGGSAQGHFTCLMAGSSVFTGFEPLMMVNGEVAQDPLTSPRAPPGCSARAR